ncbi:MAG: hypothetical protein OXC60_18650 [Litoreibacter sp.]|nr:hypothetical protein [Litoreibacter sp.]
MADKGSFFSACSVVMPPRWPVSTSTLLTHSFSVCGVQPNFDEIETIAAQRLSCCPAPYSTIRTARSYTSGEYLFVAFVMMLHPTHELEPPENPARFRTTVCHETNRREAEGFILWTGDDQLGAEFGKLSSRQLKARMNGTIILKTRPLTRFDPTTS